MKKRICLLAVLFAVIQVFADEYVIRSKFEFCKNRIIWQEPLFNIINQMEQKSRNTVEKVTEHPGYTPCPVIDQIVVQLHNRPDILYPVAIQKKLKLFFRKHTVHIFP